MRGIPALSGAGRASDRSNEYETSFDLGCRLFCNLFVLLGADFDWRLGRVDGAGGAAGSTLSNGNTISGTGGSPGPNTSNALNRGAAANNMGAPQASRGATEPASQGNAVDTPAANAATQNLGNTDTGILKK